MVLILVLTLIMCRLKKSQQEKEVSINGQEKEIRIWLI
jgi:hypothetical protein